MREHYHCVKEIFELYNTSELLKNLAKRPDLDTICAWDYNRMKKYALQSNGLSYRDYNPAAQGISVPKLD